MNQKINERQIKAILDLSVEKRYEHTIKQIVGWNTLWILQNKELSLDLKQEKYIFVWPAKEYMDIYLSNKKNLNEKKKLELDFFLEEISIKLIEKDTFICVFPTLQDKGHFLSCESFCKDLLIELDEY